MASREDNKFQAAVDAFHIHASKQLAADTLRIPRTTLLSRLKAAGLRGLKPSAAARRARNKADAKLEAQQKAEHEALVAAGTASPGSNPGDAPLAVDPVKERIRDENTRLRRELKEIHRENQSAAEVRRSIFGLAETPAEAPNWMFKVPSKASGVVGVPCAIWSDWHLGEVVVKSEVNGVNEFNMRIAEDRVKRLVDRMIDLCFSHMTNPKYPGIVINLIGDIVSGELHPEHQETNEQEINEIILFARKVLIGALNAVADAFGNVYVACAPGNHGRDPRDRRPRSKRYVARNADWLVYCLVEQHFNAVGDKRLRFQIPDTGECLYSVYGHRYMAVHGDDLGVKGGDGIIGAIGPIMRGEIKMRHSQAQIGRDYDTLLMGHWHQTLWLPRAIVNNTLKGYDEYARRVLRAVATPAAQLLWFTHPKRGITAKWEIILDDRPAVSGAPWVSWEAP